MKLDERLALCASFVRRDKKIADVGTDHAYLPIWLVKQGITYSAVAADIRVGPLKNAENNIAENGLSDRIQTVLSDGLEKISPDEADDIVIAGMGGELMIKIIESAPWLKNNEKRLILQPMTRAEELREYLCTAGFCIMEEKACISCKKSYSVMLCCYDGKVRECDDIYRYVGDLSKDKSSEALRYIYVVNEKLKKKIKGYEKGTEEYEKTAALIDQFSEIILKGGKTDDNSRGDI